MFFRFAGLQKYLSRWQESLLFYSQVHHSDWSHECFLADLPRNKEEIVWAIQGLLLHDTVAKHYETRNKTHPSQNIPRTADSMFRAICNLDPRPWSRVRSAKDRLVVSSDRFCLLLLSCLRFQGIASRIRFGFADYLIPDAFFAHAICEIYEPSVKKWILIDPHLDEVQRDELSIDFDYFDVPRNRFLTASDAWLHCRAFPADRNKFHSNATCQHGLPSILQNLVRDLAVLNNRNVLSTDHWGIMPLHKVPALGQEDSVEYSLYDFEFSFYDFVARVTSNPDYWFPELKQLFHFDDRLFMPKLVYNLQESKIEVADI